MTGLVLDTNVLVSGMINAFGAPGQIVDLIREGLVDIVVDDRILAEYVEVLNRPKFRTYFSVNDARDVLAFFERNSRYVVATVHVKDLPDPDDKPFLEVALSASVPLVTGNADDFPASRRRAAKVLSPVRFLEQFAGCPPRTRKLPGPHEFRL